MALIKPLEVQIIGARARCREHSGTVLSINEDKCIECRIIERNLNMKPPFKAKCVDGGWGFQKGETYDVFWVLRDVINDFGTRKSGYVFKSGGSHFINEHIMDADDFCPVLYLNDEGEDEWRVEDSEEQEWVQDEPKERDFQDTADEVTNLINEQGLENVG
jgi:hypothetical protein